MSDDNQAMVQLPPRRVAQQPAQEGVNPAEEKSLWELGHGKPIASYSEVLGPHSDGDCDGHGGWADVYQARKVSSFGRRVLKVLVDVADRVGNFLSL